MGHDIYLTSAKSPALYDEKNFLGEIDSSEQTDLIYNEFDFQGYSKFTEKGGTLEDFKKYLSEHRAMLHKKFPMISRLNDFYADAFFDRDEILKLIEEIKTFDRLAKLRGSKKLLNQLLEAAETALENNTGLGTYAD